jgi:hypothetical protein
MRIIGTFQKHDFLHFTLNQVYLYIAGEVVSGGKYQLLPQKVLTACHYNVCLGNELEN